MKISGKRSLSSRLWLNRQAKDLFIKQAHQDGYRSRAVFKLMEIDDKFHLIKGARYIVDLGAAPGGWSQLLAERTSDNSKIAAVDLLDFFPIDKVVQFKGDFEDEVTQQLIIKYLNQKANLVVSDMAPSTVGHAATDHIRIMNLVQGAFSFASNILKKNGAFVAKVFQGGEEKRFFEMLRKNFQKVYFFKPKSSRSLSVEIFIIAIGFKKCN